MSKKLLFILLMGFLLRLIALNQSLWLDEATTGRVVQEYGFRQIITQFSPNDFHPPLYYLLMKLWTNIFGYSEIALRMPSIAFSLLTGYLVYLLGKKLKNEATGLWAGVFFLFNPLIVYYSQEARMYMMATFLLTSALYASLFQKPKYIIIFVLLIFMSMFTFYGSIFFIIPLLIYFLYVKRYRYFFYSILGLLLTLPVLSPLLLRQLLHAKDSLQSVVNWTSALGKANLKNLLLIPIKFSIGRISFEPKWIYWFVSILWTGWVMFLTVKGAMKNKALLLLLIIPIVLGFIASFITPLLSYFRFLYLVPLLSFFLASGTDIFHLKGEKWILLMGFIVFSLFYLLNPNFHREDWKTLSAKIPMNIPVFMIIPSSDPFTYYQKNAALIELRSVGSVPPRAKNIVVIPYTSPIYGYDYERILGEQRYRKEKTENFRGGVNFELWKKLR